MHLLILGLKIWGVTSLISFILLELWGISDYLVSRYLKGLVLWSGIILILSLIIPPAIVFLILGVTLLWIGGAFVAIRAKPVYREDWRKYLIFIGASIPPGYSLSSSFAATDESLTILT